MAVNLPYTLQSLPKSQSNEWVRPSDWPVITDTPNEVWILVNDTGAGYISLVPTFTTGTASVEWGDGTSQLITIGTPFTKYYTPGTGTPCSRGYTTFKIRVSGTGLTPGDFRLRPNTLTPTNSNGTAIGTAYNQGILEWYYGDGTRPGAASAMFSSVGGTGTLGNFQQLEYVKFAPQTTGTLNLANFFQNCVNLGKVILPSVLPSGGTSMASCFQGCVNLREIVFPDTMTSIGGSINSFNSTFSGCTNLRSVTFPISSNPLSTTGLFNTATDYTTMFLNCYNLRSIDLPWFQLPTSSSTINTLNMFNTCVNLTSANIRLPYGTSAGTMLFTNFFSACSSLEYVNITNAVSGGLESNVNIDMSSMFLNCSSLKQIVIPKGSPTVGLRITTLFQTFSGCVQLQSATLPLILNACTAMNLCFSGCNNLTSVTLPNSTPVCTSAVSMFANCTTLGSITVPFSLTAAGSVSSMFLNCSNLKYVSMANMITSGWNNTFQNCLSLKTVILPSQLGSSLSANFNTNAMFSGCSSLESISIPTLVCPPPSSSTTGAILASMFNGCSELTSVTFAGSSTFTCTSSLPFSNMFANCFSLKEVDLTPLSNITFSGANSVVNMFQNCYSLKTIKWFSSANTPNSTTFVATGIDNVVQNCVSLIDFINYSNLSGNASSLLTWNNNSTFFQLVGLTASQRYTRFINAGNVISRANLQNLRLTATAATGQYGGVSPQVDVSYTNMGQAALVQLFNDLPTLTAKTINITSCPGAALLTAGERAIATGKGWTITG